MSTEIPRGAVVVGVDGSEHARRAVRWAADHAELEDRPLALLHAAAPPSPLGTTWLDTMGVDQVMIIEEVTEASHRLLAEAAASATADRPGLAVHQVLRLCDPRQALLDAAADASLLVVGSRGLGAVRGMLLGSVGNAVAKHAACPVVVVRRRDTDGPGAAGVVVGVEGGPADPAVLELAFRYAAAHGLTLTAVHCFWDEVRVAEGSHDVPDDEPGLDDQRQLLADALRDVREKFPDVPVRAQLTRGFVDDRMVRASLTAELVVVGHRRKKLLTELVYGSLAPAVVEHAHCSVAVVPSTEPSTGRIHS
jgi:nucleotide-binding universal stress UspA family protein